jgi:hypothetical protein
MPRDGLLRCARNEGERTSRLLQHRDEKTVRTRTTWRHQPAFGGLQRGFPLTPYNRATFYGGDVAGYTDYPEHNELEQA